MQKLCLFLALMLFSFIVWVIFMANTGQDMLLFKVTRQIPFGDKLGHIFVFGGLTLMANLAFKGKVLNGKLGSVYWGTAAVLIFVTLEELSQHFVATRSLDLLDYLANLVGILSFTWLSKEVMKKASFFNKASY